MNLIGMLRNRKKTMDEHGEAIVRIGWFDGSASVDTEALIRSESFKRQLDEAEKFEQAYKSQRAAPA